MQEKFLLHEGVQNLSNLSLTESRSWLLR